MNNEESIFKFDDRPSVKIVGFVFERLVKDQYKFWFGLGLGLILALIFT